MTASVHQQVPYTRKKMISLGSRLIACCKLVPTLTRQMWRHNYVIDRNEYLIFTLLESINPCVYSLQFLFKSTNNSWRLKENVSGVFFSEHSVYSLRPDSATYRLVLNECWQNLVFTVFERVVMHAFVRPALTLIVLRNFKLYRAMRLSIQAVVRIVDPVTILLQSIAYYLVISDCC